MQAVNAARLEEQAQLELFGLVEGGHDVDEADLRTRISGGALFLAMLDAQEVKPEASAAVRRDVDKAMQTLTQLGL